MTDIGPRTPELGHDSTWDSRLDDAVLRSRAFNALQQMKNTEGFALTEDSYTARIPGHILRSWSETLEKMIFRLHKE